MSSINLLYKKEYKINEHIGIYIPTVGEVLGINPDGSATDGVEDNYYSIIYSLTAMPIDMMVFLDDANIDFSQINDYELFLILFPGLKDMDTSLIFHGLDLKKFDYDENKENKMVVLRNTESGAVIDREIHAQIANTLRMLHHLEKDKRKPANKEAMDFMIERARKKMKRSKNKKEPSNLETLICAMVNTEQFKYKYEEVLNLSIYQFNESVKQIIKKVDYDNKMRGVYAGTISAKDLSQDDFNWLTHK